MPDTGRILTDIVITGAILAALMKLLDWALSERQKIWLGDVSLAIWNRLDDLRRVSLFQRLNSRSFHVSLFVLVSISYFLALWAYTGRTMYETERFFGPELLAHKFAVFVMLLLGPLLTAALFLTGAIPRRCPLYLCSTKLGSCSQHRAVASACWSQCRYDHNTTFSAPVVDGIYCPKDR